MKWSYPVWHLYFYVFWVAGVGRVCKKKVLYRCHTGRAYRGMLAKGNIEGWTRGPGAITRDGIGWDRTREGRQWEIRAKGILSCGFPKSFSLSCSRAVEASIFLHLVAVATYRPISTLHILAAKKNMDILYQATTNGIGGGLGTSVGWTVGRSVGRSSSVQT